MTTMQVKLRHWPGMRLTWLGAGAVIHAGDEPSPGAASLVVSPHGSTECAVVISSHSVKLLPPMVEELAEVLANGLPRGFTAMRFVAWDGACAGTGRPAAAHLIAMRLGIDIISPAGPLLGVPGGSLFAPIGRGDQRPGGWWRFRSGASPVRVGWRFPAPHWEADLGEVSELAGDLVLDHIPAGLWLHRHNVGSVTDLAYSVPTDPSHPALILSHPSEAPLHREELGRGMAAIPTLTADRVVFTPYGQRPLVDGPIGPVVADLLGRAVHVRTGLPLCAPAGQRAVVTIDGKGLPRWRTFARELWHAPRAGAPRTVDWTNPAPDVLTVPAGAATFALGAGWVCEVIEAGLWIRPEQLADPADWIRALPVDVNRCAIVVGAPHAPEITPPGHMIAGVLERMPVDARKRAYLAVPRGAAPNVFVLAAGLRDRLPEGGEVELLGPVVPVPAPAHTPLPPTLTPPPPLAAHPVTSPAHANGGPNGHTGSHVAVPRALHREQPPRNAFHREPPPVDRLDVPSRPPRSSGFQEAPAARHQPVHNARPPEREFNNPPVRDVNPPRREVVEPIEAVPVVDDTSTGSSHRDRAIRSHRNDGKPTKREDDRTSTQELDRLLGFFDEIRRAKAWDEDAKSQEEQDRAQRALGQQNGRRGRR
jgi:hypothetical protein